MVMARKRITISLNRDMPADKAVWEFILGLPRRTRSEIIKEILLDALEKKDDRAEVKPQTPDVLSGTDVIDPEEIIEKLF
jgi:metal-responsive CopG/Arc/MetJ family transcriptional regulator